MNIESIEYKDAVAFIVPRHYSGRKPSISYSFGVREKGVIVAAVTIGKPPSNTLCDGVCGKEYSSDVYELNRICVDGMVEHKLSQLVSYALKNIGNKVLVSYSDTAAGHVGYIYQATNWLYTGATRKRTERYSGESKHSRHYDKEEKQVYRKVRSSKHRYVIFCGGKKYRKGAMKSLRYETFPYPKGDSSRYKLGDFLKPEIYKLEERQ